MDVKETSLDLDVKDEVAFWMERNGSSDEVKFDAAARIRTAGPGFIWFPVLDMWCQAIGIGRLSAAAKTDKQKVSLFA